MKIFTDDRPIIACSTGSFTNTAISLIRLSGFKNLSEFQSIFEFNLTKTKPRYSHLTNLVSEGKVIDNLMFVFFPEGKSFTGENCLELHVHGNLLNVERIINLFVEKFNFRLAHPGEFSYRAYKNKKLSLSQIEGLDLFLNANSNLMLEQGLDVLQGQLHDSYLKLYDLYLKLKSSVELLIDFSEDVGEDYAREMYFSLLVQFKKLLDTLHSRAQGNFSSLMNPEIVIAGETNAGKSSFFNSVLNHDRSIVSNIKGTTRDYISEVVNNDGTNFILVDTAGIRETFDEIEKIGISRSYEKLKHGFFKILLINLYEFDEKFFSNLENISFDLVIFSHADIADFPSRIKNFSLEKINSNQFLFCSFKTGSIGPILKDGSIGPVLESGSIGPKNKGGSIGPVVLDLVSKKYREMSKNNPILLERHRNKINELHSYLNQNYSNISELGDLAIASSEINKLGVELSELIGQVSADDVLNSVFSNFCIGK